MFIIVIAYKTRKGEEGQGETGEEGEGAGGEEGEGEGAQGPGPTEP